MTKNEWKDFARYYKNKGKYSLLIFLIYRCYKLNKDVYDYPYQMVEKTTSRMLHNWFNAISGVMKI